MKWLTIDASNLFQQNIKKSCFLSKMVILVCSLVIHITGSIWAHSAWYMSTVFMYLVDYSRSYPHYFDWLQRFDWRSKWLAVQKSRQTGAQLRNNVLVCRERQDSWHWVHDFVTALGRECTDLHHHRDQVRRLHAVATFFRTAQKLGIAGWQQTVSDAEYNNNSCADCGWCRRPQKLESLVRSSTSQWRQIARMTPETRWCKSSTNFCKLERYQVT